MARGDQARPPRHGVSTAGTAFYRFAFGLPPLLVWIALTGNVGASAHQRPLAHLARGAIGLPRRWWWRSPRSSMLPLRRGDDDRLRRAALLGRALGADPQRGGRAAPLERGRDRLRRRADRHAARRHAHLPPIGLALRAAGRSGRRRRDDHAPPDRPDRGTPTIGPLVHLLLDARDRPVPALLRSRRIDARPGLILIAARPCGRARPAASSTSSLRFAPVPVVVPFDYVAAALGGAARLAALGHPSRWRRPGRRRGDHRQRPLHDLSRAQARPRHVRRAATF